MPKLSNDTLRQKSMNDFLIAIGISTEEIKVNSNEGLFSFGFTDESQAA